MIAVSDSPNGRSRALTVLAIELGLSLNLAEDLAHLPAKADVGELQDGEYAGNQGAADEDCRHEANAAEHDQRVGADHHEDRLHHHARDRFGRAGNAFALEEREA